MNVFKTIPFRTKVTTSYIAVLLAAVIAMGSVTTFRLSGSTSELGAALCQSTVEDARNLFEVQLAQLKDKLAASSQLLEYEFMENLLTKEQLLAQFKKRYHVNAAIYSNKDGVFTVTASSFKGRGQTGTLGSTLTGVQGAGSLRKQGDLWTGQVTLPEGPGLATFRVYDDQVILMVASSILTDEFVGYMKDASINGHGGFAILDNQGTILAHKNPSLVGTTLQNSKLVSARDARVPFMEKGEAQFGYVGYLPEWNLRILFTLTDKQMQFGLDREILISALLGCAAAGTVCLLFIILMSSYINKGVLLKVRDMATAIADGNYDHKVDYPCNDNIRVMLNAMESMADQIRLKMAEAKESSEEANYAHQEAQAALENANMINEQMEMTNERIMFTVAKAESTSDTMFTTAEAMSLRLRDIAGRAQDQSSRASSTVSAMNEMASSVAEVARMASNAANGAKGNLTRARASREIMAQAIKAIGEVQQANTRENDTLSQTSAQADAIGTILTTISDIADQTNLLALNAAIEAARAGDAGRGFAVVADEVRKLAEKTQQATSDVANSIHGIQQSVGELMDEKARSNEALSATVESATEADQRLETIVNTIQMVADNLGGIAAAAEQQSSAADQVNSSMEDVNAISNETTEAMQDALAAISELESLCKDLGEIIRSLG